MSATSLAAQCLSNESGMNPKQFECFWLTVHRFGATQDPLCKRILPLLSIFLPCSLCRSHLEGHLSRSVVAWSKEPKLDWFLVFCQFHNTVNESLDKPILDQKEIQTLQSNYTQTVRQKNKPTPSEVEWIHYSHQLEYSFWLSLSLIVLNYPVHLSPEWVPRHRMLANHVIELFQVWFSLAVKYFRFSPYLDESIFQTVKQLKTDSINRKTLSEWFFSLIQVYYPPLLSHETDRTKQVEQFLAFIETNYRYHTNKQKETIHRVKEVLNE